MHMILHPESTYTTEMDLEPPGVLMRSKNTRQLADMLMRAKASPSRSYTETRGDHTFCVTWRMRTRFFPFDGQCVTRRSMSCPHVDGSTRTWWATKTTPI
jgi:hypothetical protein